MQMGQILNREWGVGAQQSLYSQDGTVFQILERFPAALFDPNGYIEFATKEQFDEFCNRWRETPSGRIERVTRRKKLTVSRGIASHREYVRMRPYPELDTPIEI
jgi:hypothetical protein